MILNDVSYEKFSIYCIYGVLLKILLYFRNFSEANTCSNPILLVINSKKIASLNHIFIDTRIFHWWIWRTDTQISIPVTHHWVHDFIVFLKLHTKITILLWRPDIIVFCNEIKIYICIKICFWVSWSLDIKIFLTKLTLYTPE